MSHSFAVLAVLLLCVSAEATPPHVLFFLSDDLGWSNVNFHNSKAFTPTLDKLRSEGVELTRHYACELVAAILV